MASQVLPHAIRGSGTSNSEEKERESREGERERGEEGAGRERGGRRWDVREAAGMDAVHLLRLRPIERVNKTNRRLTCAVVLPIGRFLITRGVRSAVFRTIRIECDLTVRRGFVTQLQSGLPNDR